MRNRPKQIHQCRSDKLWFILISHNNNNTVEIDGNNYRAKKKKKNPIYEGV